MGKETLDLSKRLRAEGAQGHPQTPKMDTHSTPRPQNDPQMAPQALQRQLKTPKMHPKSHPKTTKMIPRLSKSTSESQNPQKLFKIIPCIFSQRDVWAGGVTPWRKGISGPLQPSILVLSPTRRAIFRVFT